jgi:hypothetical protein
MRLVWVVVGGLVLLAFGAWIVLHTAPSLPDLVIGAPG